MKFKILIVLSTLFIVSCQTNPNRYNQLGLSENELATVTCEKTSLFDSKFQSYILGVYTESNVEVIGTSAFGTPEHKIVKIQPGKYVFNVMCDNGSVYAYPKVAVELEASTDYILSCESILKEGILGIDMVDKLRAVIKKSDEISINRDK